METEEGFDAFGEHANDRRPTWLINYAYSDDLGKKSDEILDFATSRLDAHPTSESMNYMRSSGSLATLLELTDDNIYEYGDLLRQIRDSKRMTVYNSASSNHLSISPKNKNKGQEVYSQPGDH